MQLLKLIARYLMKWLYRVDVCGLEHFGEAGRRVLIVANHASFLDAALLALFLPEKLTFVVNTHIAERWWLKPFLRLVAFFPMDPLNPLSTKSLISYLREDNKAVIFPEGRITVTGSLMKIYQGPGLVADRAEASILPIRIEGAQYTPFSRLRGRVRLHWFPRIRLTVLPSRRITLPGELTGRQRRLKAGQALSDIMTEMMFATSNYHSTLFNALLNARRVHGGGHVVVEDVERKPLTYNQLLHRAFMLADILERRAIEDRTLGIMLPNAVGTVVLFLALHLYNKIPAMLNFTLGTGSVSTAVDIAQIRHIITSRRFIELAQLQGMVEALAQKAEIIYLEDLREGIGKLDMVMTWLDMGFAQSAYNRLNKQTQPDDPAVILFTSGSEGTPKGVVLSHANLLANREQLASRVDFSSQDVILNALPLFHSFGLTAGTLLPLLSGMKVFFYPSPLHYRIVPEVAYDVNATILFGTNTFLAGYARFAHPYDFYSIRYVFAGAEKLQEGTSRIWAGKFGIRIFEGYGATETSPVLATNTAMDYRLGSVGRFLPGIEHRLETVPGVEQGGRLHVRGPNVMLGYLLKGCPGQCVPPSSTYGSGWYDTGDIVHIDDEGYAWIRGRARRFAKVGGEMVSLTAVEALAERAWPGSRHAVVTLPDSKKGEQLVLLSEYPQAMRSALLEAARAAGMSELHVPKKILVTLAIPLLASGKTDYATARTLAEKEVPPEEEGPD
jgi:acyl-[acyl-carrier-protein]-phospholipid O-acyltransferase/long-chain-fatty-acid--[acyl-carrier-protein] ligase